MGVPAAQTQFHVLAVDDSLIDRKIIERLLKTSSYQVTTVDSGSKALEILGLQDDKANSPTFPLDHEVEVNMIITDYCMPGMTGYDLLKKIKESSSLRDIPVVIMSSENVPSRINRCLEEGAEEFLLKPVQLSDMKRLRPHILKGKSKEQEQEQEQEMQQQPQPSPPIQDNPSIIIEDLNNSSISTSSDSSNGISNKRKPMEEGLPLERTRPRFSKGNLTVL